jgi:hypothetical protein
MKNLGLMARMSFALLAIGCLSTAYAAPAKTKMDKPLVSCSAAGTDYIDLLICAASGTGATGAPAGVTVQWITAADFAAGGSNWNNVLACDASFSGNANLSRYNLLPGQCVTVRIGQILLDAGASTSCLCGVVPTPCPLICGTTYVFRAFAHGNSTLNRSDFTSNLNCSTAACPIGCDPNVKSFGFWKQHFPDAWPADVLANGMTIGCQSYTAAQLESILLATPAGGNELIALAHQVINARMNIVNGAGSAYVAAVSLDLANAEALMCTVGAVPPVGTGSLNGAQAGPLTLALDAERAQYECQEGGLLSLLK